ncbi:MAG: murein biosynthesis integral membrane protein MurJ [Armatimonadetes bacterium]|nr:murein biosynthesis integral membrane protein MurJ [Armatimonadota bacterium]
MPVVTGTENPTVSAPTPPKPDFGKASGIMVLSLFLSRVLGLLRNTIVAAMFGQTVLTDAYRQSFAVPDVLFFLIAGGALSSAFIPVFSEYLHTGRESEAWHVFSSVTSWMSVIITVFIVLAWVFAYPLLQLLVPGSPATWQTASDLSRIVLPAQLAFFVGGLMFGTLYARQVFTVPGLGPNLYNLGIIFGAVVLSHFVSPKVAGMSWGALAGAFLGNVVLPLFAIRKLGGMFKVTFDTKHPGVRKVFRLMLPVVFGLSLPAVFGLVMQYFGSFYGAGMPTALDNADRIMQAPLAVFGQSFAIAAFPALSQFYATGRMDAYRDQLSRSLRTVLYITVPVSALLIAMPEGVIKILLEHGRFTEVETARTAPILQLLSFGVAAWCVQPILMRAFFAVQQTLWPIVVSTVTTAVFLVLCTLLTKTPLAHLGLPLAGSVAAVVLATVLLTTISRHTGDLDMSGILTTLGKCFIAAAVMAVPCWSVMRWMLGANLSKPVFGAGFVVLGLAGCWVYIAVTRRMQMPETAYVDRAMAKLDKKRKSPGSDEPDAPSDPQGPVA